ncbi:LOW QUALITY PROTEIN: hypothetical protein PHMEG_00029537 [Phytophthora megakarya]|uniref:Reverse transcriptase n=1 Tax=Phytophthora megakarya TaxID=4795 RepID=A0A225V0V3_9STRA|nr:LOW QUALITY PROTEIN: hypothetical protein PHMEG_00029537 [Phytophthora megakarya]
MYADVERHVKECVDCASGKGHPSNPGPSPGNIEPRRPFEVVSMDFVTHMPKSERGNTFLLLFQDMFSGFTVIRSVRAYVAEADQSDWDDHAERLMFALNTSFDATRLDTPFYLVHGWDAYLQWPKPSSLPGTAYEWRRKFQRDYRYARACTKYLHKKAKRLRSEVQTQKWRELSERLKAGFERGDAVWLYIPKVQPGLSRKLAHLWHGPFRIDEGYVDPEWIPLSQLNWGALLYEFNQGARARARFRAMQAGDDHPQI